MSPKKNNGNCGTFCLFAILIIIMLAAAPRTASASAPLLQHQRLVISRCDPDKAAITGANNLPPFRAPNKRARVKKNVGHRRLIGRLRLRGELSPPPREMFIVAVAVPTVFLLDALSRAGAPARHPDFATHAILSRTLIMLLLLIGGVEWNPGPPKTNSGNSGPLNNNNDDNAPSLHDRSASDVNSKLGALQQKEEGLLRVLTWNLGGSVDGKEKGLAENVKLLKPHLIFLTEVAGPCKGEWPESSAQGEVFTDDKYKLPALQQACHHKRIQDPDVKYAFVRWGRVAVGWQDSVDVTVLNYQRFEHSDVEALVFDVGNSGGSKKRSKMAVIYCPPRSQKDSERVAENVAKAWESLMDHGVEFFFGDWNSWHETWFSWNHKRQCAEFALAHNVLPAIIAYFDCLVNNVTEEELAVSPTDPSSIYAVVLWLLDGITFVVDAEEKYRSRRDDGSHDDDDENGRDAIHDKALRKEDARGLWALLHFSLSSSSADGDGKNETEESQASQQSAAGQDQVGGDDDSDEGDTDVTAGTAKNTTSSNNNKKKKKKNKPLQKRKADNVDEKKPKSDDASSSYCWVPSWEDSKCDTDVVLDNLADVFKSDNHIIYRVRNHQRKLRATMFASQDEDEAEVRQQQQQQQQQHKNARGHLETTVEEGGSSAAAADSDAPDAAST